MKTLAAAFGFALLLSSPLMGTEQKPFPPTLSNHPSVRPADHVCTVSSSREPLRYYTGRVIKEGHRLLLDADSYPRAAGSINGEPATRKTRNGWTISFALDRPDDVEVRILDAAGSVVRRLGCGVLGANAPEPFRKDQLAQDLFWDGLDAAGKPAPPGCRAEVRVGLTPRFEQFIGHDPASIVPQLIALEVDPQGRLYVGTSAENRSDPTLVRFDREGRYLDMVYPPGPHQLGDANLRTLYPWAETLDRREVPTRARAWPQYIYQWPAGTMLPFRIDARGNGYIAEILTGWGSADVQADTAYRVFPAGDGRRFWFLQNISLLQTNGAFALDGKGGAYLAARGFDLSKGASAFDREGVGRIRRVDLSTGRPDPAFKWNGDIELAEPSALLGAPTTRPAKSGRAVSAKMPLAPTTANTDVDSPSRFVDIKDMAVDSLGRLLVVDSKPRRIKVFESNGRFMGTVERLRAAGVERRFTDIRALRVVNDELYLLATLDQGQVSLIKCRGDMLAPELVWEQPVNKAAQFLAVDARADADPSAGASRLVWCGNGDGPGTITRVEDEGARCGAPRHFGGTKARCFPFPCSIAADGEGRLFVYDLVLKKIVRTDDSGTTWKEVDAPFPLATLFVDRMARRLLVTAPGKVACYDLDLTRLKDFKFHPAPTTAPGTPATTAPATRTAASISPWGTRSGGVVGGVDRDGNVYVSDGLSDKEAKGAELTGRIRRYGPDGVLRASALAQLTFPSGSMALDSRGNLYALDLAYAQQWTHVSHNLPLGLGRDGVGAARLMFRRGDHPVWEQSDLCYMVKFGPAGGVRNTPTELWSHRGFSPHPAGGCQCDWPRGVLAIDAADRIFGADSIHHHVKVLDSAGNLITRLGWWGNAQTIPPAGDARDFGFWNIYGLTAAGDDLYVSDKDLRRIAKFRMDYRQTRIVAAQ